MPGNFHIKPFLLSSRSRLIEAALIGVLIFVGFVVHSTVVGRANGASGLESAELVGLAVLLLGGVGFLACRFSVMHDREVAHRITTERRFQLLVQRATDYAIFTLDHNGIVSNWNSGAQRVYDYAADEIVGQHFSRFYTPADCFAALPSKSLRAAAAVGRYETEGWCLRKDGTHFWASVLTEAVRDEHGALAGFAQVTRDITDRRRNEQRLHRLTHFDSLTELVNRHVLLIELEEALKKDKPVAVLAIKLNGFKEINNTLSHPAGDAILKAAGERIQFHLMGKGRVGCLGGDQFGVIAANLREPLKVAALSQQLIEALASGFAWEDQQVHLNPSIGIAISPDHGTSGQELLANADLALYRARAEGGQSYRFFQPDFRQAALLRRACERDLRRAVAQGELELFYQPQVALANRRIVGAEALLRWRHPERGLVAPGAFLPVLESGPLAATVGDWAIHQACAFAAAARQRGTNVQVGVNLFGAQFHSGELISKVRSALAHYKLAADALELEITENIMLKYDEVMVAPLRKLRADGVGVAFDDYGTGYASLSLLKRYPLSRLKIDQSFVRNVALHREDAAVVQAVLYLGRSFGLEVIAEGVESEAHERLLQEYGCKEAQGYLYGRPMPAEQLLQMLSQPLSCSHHLTAARQTKRSDDKSGGPLTSSPLPSGSAAR